MSADALSIKIVAAAPLAVKIVGTAAAPLVAGLGAAGTGTSEAYKETGELSGEEWGYGTMSGVVEGGIEAATMGVGKGIEAVGGAVGKKIGKETIENAGKSLGKETAKTLASKSMVKRVAGDMLGEGFEEGVTELIDPYLKRMTYDPSAENATMQEIGYAALVGALSGGITTSVTRGTEAAVDLARDYKSGRTAASKGEASEIIATSRIIAENERKNGTGYDAPADVTATLTKLEKSIEKTGGEVKTAVQERLLGRLKRGNVSTVASSLMYDSVKNVLSDPEGFVTRFNEYGMKGVDGQPMTLTADELVKGVDASTARGIMDGLKSNAKLRSIAAMDAAGRLMLDTAAMKNSVLQGQAIASERWLASFYENASDAEMNELSAKLGVDMRTATADEIRGAAEAYRRNPENAAVQEQIAAAKKIASESARTLPKRVAIVNDGVRRYKADGVDIAVMKSGDTYRIYEYETGDVSRALSVDELNRAVRKGVKQADDRSFALLEGKVESVIETAIKQKGKLDVEYNQVRISAFPDHVSSMVNKASDGKIYLDKKHIAVNGDNVWHEYKRHKDADVEIGRRQLPLTQETIKEAIMAIYDPDIVESLFVSKENPTQRQSFVYAKKSPAGYYVVVEAVGGRHNPNVTPAMIVRFNEAKWNDMISSGATLGEILYENDPDLKAFLDVEFNKKNRVTAAQFASIKAIANTPHSPRYDSSIPDFTKKVNTETKNSEKNSSNSEKKTERKLEAERIDKLLREKVKDYREISDGSQTLVRQVYRQALAHGLSESEALTFARISAHSGVGVMFSKNLCRYKDEDGNVKYGDGWYSASRNKIIINPEGTRSMHDVLIHELDHAIRKAYKGKTTVYMRKVFKNLTEDERNAIIKAYKGVKTDNRIDLLDDEFNAFFAEKCLKNRDLQSILFEKEPTILKRIVDFFTGASKAYSDDPKLARAAKWYEKRYRKMFEDFSARNKGSNAVDTVTRINQENMQVSGDERNALAFDGEQGEWEKPITIQDIETLRLIGEKSINEFTANDIEKSQKWAHKFYQELGVKSPFFRAWFGDWRARDKSKAPYIDVIKTTNVSSAATGSKFISNGLKDKTLFRGNVINNDTSYEINIGRQVYNDTLTYANRALSRDNDFNNYAARLSLLYDIKEIAEKAILLDTVTIKSNESNLDRTFVHKFYATAKVNNSYYIVKLTVDEFNAESKTIRRAYNVNNIEISPIAVSQVYNPAGTIDDIGEFLSKSIVADLFEFVKRYDTEFKPNSVNPLVLNEDGTPKVFYHGTNEKWTEYDMSKNVNQMYGEGIYLTPDPTRARLYGDIIMPFYVRATTDFRTAKKTGKTRDYTYVEKTGDIIVKSPAQIKSATDNIGTFDGSNSDIRFAMPHGQSTPSTAGNVGKTSFKAAEAKVGQRIKASFGTARDRLYIETVDETFGVEKYLRKVGGREDAIPFVQQVRAAETMAQTMIGTDQYDITKAAGKGKRLGDGLATIFKPIRTLGKRIEGYDAMFDDYLLHQLNVDRMTLEERSVAEQKDRVERLAELNKRVEEIKNRLTENKKEFADMKGKRDATSKARRAEIREENKKLVAEHNSFNLERRAVENAINAFVPLQNKPVFGENAERKAAITAEESRKVIEEYEKKHPQFKEIAEKVWKYSDNLLEMRVGGGLISAESAAEMRKLYPHYVPSFRDVDGGGRAVPVKGAGNMQVSSTVKRAKGGGEDIISIEESLAKQTTQAVKAIQINRLARAVADSARTAGDTEYVRISSEETQNSKEKQQEKEYGSAAVKSEIIALVQEVEKGKAKDNEKVELKQLPKAVSQKIQEITGIDVSGFKIVIEARQIGHILKDHGKNGKTDQSMANVEDIAKIEFTMQSPDSISPSGKTQAYSYMKNGRNRTSDTVIYEKEIGEKSYYVVQAVADTNKKTLFVVSAFIGKKGYKKETSQLIDANKSPNATSYDGSVVVSKNIISENEEKVNTFDENFFKYIPDGFLTKEQLRSKERALEREAKKYGYIPSDPSLHCRLTVKRKRSIIFHEIPI